MKLVTDPAILAQLNSGKPVTDPALLAQLNASAQPETLGQQINQGANALGQGFTDSVAETAGAVPDLVSAGLRAVGATGLAPRNPHFYANAIKSGIDKLEDVLSNITGGGQINHNAPTSGIGKTAYAVGHGAGDAASVFVPASAAGRVAREGSAAGKIAKALASQPVAQTVAGAAGSGVSQATDNPYLGLAASLVVPGVAGIGKGALVESLGKRATIKAAPDTKALAQEGSSLFDQALANKATVSSQSYDNLLNDMGETLKKEGAAPMLHPKIAAVYNVLSDTAGSTPTLQDLQIARRQIGVAANSNEPDERRIAHILQDKLDDFVNNLQPSDMATGSAGASVSDLQQARNLWSRMRKSQIIDDAIERASHQASGVENGLRTQFRQLLNNKKKMRGFTSSERAAIKDVVDGNFTRNSLRRLGRLSPGSGVQSNIHNATIGGGLGYVAGYPLVGASIPIVAYGAQRAAQASEQQAANYARALTALGNQAPSRLAQLLGASNTPGLLASTLLGQEKTPILNKILGKPQSSGSLPQK